MNPRGAEFRPVLSLTEAGTAMTTWAVANPEKVQAAMDFVSNFIPGDVPVQSKAGLRGTIVREIWDRIHE
ncbi:hypothetical protein [Paucidesulfovibrio longus]|uniref:hypothetical protein n=1 Tax=Paucidesulfovibrio longus TaxID=889 RepID=UPI0003B37BF4|nr:hypothetical protein [Paucidesulfovibrio longus]